MRAGALAHAGRFDVRIERRRQRRQLGRKLHVDGPHKRLVLGCRIEVAVAVRRGDDGRRQPRAAQRRRAARLAAHAQHGAVAGRVGGRPVSPAQRTAARQRRRGGRRRRRRRRGAARRREAIEKKTGACADTRTQETHRERETHTHTHTQKTNTKPATTYVGVPSRSTISFQPALRGLR